MRLRTKVVLWQNPARDWVILFLAVQSLFLIDGGTNACSRWTTLVSIVEDKTVRTDNYFAHTMDWARTPDRHYYSNKAPGPMLLGLPVFWYLDREVTQFSLDRPNRDALRIREQQQVMRKLSLITQAIPYALVVLLFLRTLHERGLPKAALHVTAVALLFGNTAALFMNTFFGHGMSAMFVLAALLTLHLKRYGQAGLWLGFAALCDYGAALLLLPAVIVMLLDSGGRVRRVLWFALGGFIPGMIWTWYHQYCFGSPLALPNKFQNPLFVGISKDTPQLWGVLRLIPDTRVLQELLVGSARGLLFTQGWVFVALAAVLGLFVVGLWDARFVIHDRLLRDSAIFSFVGLALVLVMNCSFNGWHGGMAPGPRYLAIVLPPCAVTAGLLFPKLPAFLRHLMVLSLSLSVVLFILVYGTHNLLVPENALFTAYLRNLMDASGIHLEHTLYLTLAIGWITYRAMRDSAATPNVSVTEPCPCPTT
jgi:uncharacterized membrane protein